MIRRLRLVTALAAGTLLISAFALVPLVTDPLGDRLETAARRDVGFDGCCGLQMIVTEDRLDEMEELKLTADSQPLTWTFAIGARDFNRRSVEIRITRDIGRGSVVLIEAPFPVFARLLYQPPLRERIALMRARLTTWCPPNLACFLPCIAVAFIALGLGLVLRIRGEDRT